MTIYQKFGFSFALALTLHLALLGMFGINLGGEPELIKQKPLPEIIKASILDDEKIQQEANRLKDKEKNKRDTQIKQQQNLVNKRKKEQKLLSDTKKKRQQEEKKAKELAKKRKDLAIKEKKKLKAIKKQKALEAARLAKIKKQKAVEKKRLDDLRKAEDKKRELARQAEQKKQQALLEKQKRDAAEKAAQRKRQADAAKAQQAKDRQATISATAAIQQKVNSRWIRPLSAIKGLNCTIRVKLLPSGDVMDAKVVRSSGDGVFDRSAENAVRKASPLPVPKNRALFTKQFRSFTFNFNPE